VYALNSSSGAVEWSDHLGTPAYSLEPPYECNNNSQQAPDIRPTIGITGTPVIDPATDTIYLAALIGGKGYVLFALSTASGRLVWNMTITPPGFHYLAEEERGSLTEANGFIYIPFGGYSWDCLPGGPVGWIVAVQLNDTSTVDSYHLPTTIEGDIWTPEGISVDSHGNLYVVTGDSDNSSFDYGNSVLKFSPTLKLLSYFAAQNWQYTNANDLDLGSTGATLLPNNLVFAVGKDSMAYILNASDLGGIGGQLYNASVCNSNGAWGATSYHSDTIYIPCGTSLDALSLNASSSPSLTPVWNFTVTWAGPPIIAGGAIWAADIVAGVFYGLNETNGAVVFHEDVGSIEHFSTPSAGGGEVFFAANETVYAIALS
jgi:hypothetical protein